MDTTNVITALQTVITDPSVTNAFDNGLYLAATIVATLLGYSLLRTLPDDGHEEL